MASTGGLFLYNRAKLLLVRPHTCRACPRFSRPGALELARLVFKRMNPKEKMRGLVKIDALMLVRNVCKIEN